MTASECADHISLDKNTFKRQNVIYFVLNLTKTNAQDTNAQSQTRSKQILTSNMTLNRNITVIVNV